jgi:3-oxoacyl-[acyl-carrier-protein] synthase II
MNNNKRVVVTGLGWVTPLGNDIDTVWEKMLAGDSGISSIKHIATEQLRTHVCGIVPEFKVDEFLSPKECRKMDLFIQYAIYAAGKALQHSGLPCDEIGHDTGVAFGSGIGGLDTIESNHNTILESGMRKVSPFFIPATITNMAPGNISIKYGLKGPNFAVTTACTTGTHNIGLAARIIASGDATAMVAGGSEYASGCLGLSGFSALKALASWDGDPKEASRPWDKDRNGFVLSDGAGAVVLEEYEYAKSRGANILAEVVGFGMSADAYHMTSPSGEGALRSMHNAIVNAGIDKNDINVINAHGTSTMAGDLVESNAVKELFGGHAKNLKISSIKSMIGHTLGAAGAIEAVASVLSLRDQIVPPTINCPNPDDGCDLDYVRHGSEAMNVKHVLSNSFGFGGTNGSVIFAKY